MALAVDPIRSPDAVLPPIDQLAFARFPDVQPFSQRTASGYQDQLESVVTYLRRLNRFLLEQNPQGVWDQNVVQLIAAINAVLDAQTADNEQKILDALEAIANSDIIITDPAMVAAFQSANSAALSLLDARYVKPATIGFLTSRFSPAPIGSGSDDTAALQAWLNARPANGVATMRSGTYTIAGTITIPAGVVLEARGAAFVGIGGGQRDVFQLAAGAWLIGADITFGTGRTGGRPVLVSGVTGARVVDCTIHDIPGLNVNDGPGIRVEAGATGYLIRGNRIARVHGQGIALDTANSGSVEANEIDTALHGIQWWGGDSASANAIGIHHILIRGNRVRNVAGGIWGSLGQYVNVSGNEVDTCSDVGIDFEGCADSTAIGNIVRNCVNAALGVFYGAIRCSFVGNTVDQTGATGAGFKAFTNETSSYIEVIDNLIRTDQGVAIVTDQQALSDSQIRGNRIIGVTQNVLGMRFIDCGNMSIEQNVVRVAAPTAISFEGGSDSRIEGNEILTLLDSTSPGANSAGIYLVWRSSQFPCKRNRVRNNILRGFVQGIFDNCYNDLASSTLIENNVATRITTRQGSNLYLFNNRDESSHAPINPTII